MIVELRRAVCSVDNLLVDEVWSRSASIWCFVCRAGFDFDASNLS